MTAAIFGLLGVVMGGVLNGAVARWQARRAESDELRAAARLLMGDLLQLHTYIYELADGQPVERPVVRYWEEHAALFARTLSIRDWYAIGGGAKMLRLLDTWRHDDQVFDICKGSVTQALDAIAGPALYGRRPSARLWTREKLRRLRYRWRNRGGRTWPAPPSRVS